MPNGELAISLRDGDKTPSQLAFAAVLQPPLFFPAIFLVFGSSPFFVFPGIGLFPGIAVLSLRGTPWFPYRRYAGNSTFKQHNKVSPPLGHWNPETWEPRVEAPGHWNLGTLEPQVHREEKGHRPEKLAVSPLRVSLPSRSWRFRRPGWCTLVAGTVFGLLFPETLRGGAVRGFTGFRRRLSILELMLLSEG